MAYRNHLRQQVFHGISQLQAPNNKIDFESAALHEIGHALGLIHTSNDPNIMYPTLDNGANKRSLTGDDLEGGQFCQTRSLVTIPQSGCGIELLPLAEDCNIPTHTLELLEI
ncbi:MAG: matrixin family metalloprotease [Bacteroidetes bacterium]|nr:matrixin family metalloprotease [Bacteroidota bacterium]